MIGNKFVFIKNDDIIMDGKLYTVTGDLWRLLNNRAYMDLSMYTDDKWKVYELILQSRIYVNIIIMMEMIIIIPYWR